MDFMSFGSTRLKAPAPRGVRRARLRPDPRTAPRGTATSRSPSPSLDAACAAFRARRCQNRGGVRGEADTVTPHSPGIAPRGLGRLDARRATICCSAPPASAASTAARELRKRGFKARSLAGGLQGLDAAPTARVRPGTREYSRRHALQEQVAGCRHDHLHRDVAPRAGGRRAQHRPGIPGLPDRSGPGGILGRVHRRRAQPICADGRRHRAARADRPEGPGAPTRSRSIPQTEITVTCGATEALYDAIQAVVGPGDEAIIFDPAYDAYEPAVRLAGGRCVRVPLSPPAFAVDWDRVRARLSERTRLDHHQQSAEPELHGLRSRAIWMRSPH